MHNATTARNAFAFAISNCNWLQSTLCWSIHPTAVEWANASATFEPHEILGVAWDVSERALRSAYRRLALEHHPDKGGDPVRFQLIVTAYEALMNRLHGHPDF